VLRVVMGLAAAGPRFDRVAIGFPGVVEDGVIRTAVNLHPAWVGLNLARRMERLTRRPTRVANDADVQGLAVVAGTGVELVLTLGTGSARRSSSTAGSFPTSSSATTRSGTIAPTNSCSATGSSSASARLPGTGAYGRHLRC